MAPPVAPPPMPGVGARRPTQEIDSLRTSLDDLTLHLRQVSEELSTERKARTDEKDRGLSVTKLHVPFVMWFATVALLVSVGTGVSVFIHSTRDHIGNDKIHVNAAEAELRGGVAYKKDIGDVLSNVEQHSRASLRAIVKNSPLVCAPLHPGDVGYGRGKTDCKFQEPEIRQ